MKRNHGVVLLALLATLAFSAIGSASASAEACHKKVGSKKWALCVEGEKTKGSGFTLALKTGTSATIANKEVNVTVKCAKASGTGAFGAAEPTNVSQFELLLQNCTVEGAGGRGCKVKQVAWGNSGVTGTFGTSAESIAFYPNEPNFVFGLLTFEGEECLEHSSGYLAGHQNCTLSGIEAEAVSHVLSCSAAVSEVTRGGHAWPVGFEETIELSGAASKKKFSIIEST